MRLQLAGVPHLDPDKPAPVLHMYGYRQSRISVSQQQTHSAYHQECGRNSHNMHVLAVDLLLGL